MEEEWQISGHLPRMLELASGRVSRRKLRLFAVACVRRHWHLLDDERSRWAVEVSERFAEGEVSPLVLKSSYAAAWSAVRAVAELGPARASAARAAARAASARAEWAAHGAAHEAGECAGWLARDKQLTPPEPAWVLQLRAATEEKRRLCDLLREIAGNPFHRSHQGPNWLTWNDRTVPRMAETIRAGWHFDHLPVLADALEEAGCGDAELLRHCREGRSHVRGCWVLDLLLGKE
jgi:hypothetical protein